MWTGDNLDIMRGMNSETVDLIYLDPPFNSNRDDKERRGFWASEAPKKGCKAPQAESEAYLVGCILFLFNRPGSGSRSRAGRGISLKATHIVHII